MPRLLWQIETPVNPHLAAADRHANEWARALGLVQTVAARDRLAATRAGSLAARCYPNAALPDLCLAADWMSWLFVIDDEGDEGDLGCRPADFEDTLGDLHGAVFGSGVSRDASPLAMALDDIWHRVRPLMSRSWQRRFVRHMSDYFAANTWQAAHRALMQIPSADTFAEMRRHAGAIWPSFDLIELVGREDLPTSLYYSRTYQALLTAAADVVCWTNDILTLPKELSHQDVHNLILVRQQADRSSLDQAIATVVRLTSRRLEQFLEAESALPQLFDHLKLSEVQRVQALCCVSMLRAWIRGHVDWGAETLRYHVDDSTWPGYPEVLLEDGLPVEIEEAV